MPPAEGIVALHCEHRGALFFSSHSALPPQKGQRSKLVIILPPSACLAYLRTYDNQTGRNEPMGKHRRKRSSRTGRM